MGYCKQYENCQLVSSFCRSRPAKTAKKAKFTSSSRFPYTLLSHHNSKVCGPCCKVRFCPEQSSEHARSKLLFALQKMQAVISVVPHA